MSKNNLILKQAALGGMAFLIAIAGLWSCKKDNNTNQGMQPVAGLMAFNLSPDKQNIGFSIDGNNLTNAAIFYPNYTGNYLNIYPGQRSVAAYDYYNPATPLATAQTNFVAGKLYSSFLVGSANNYKNILVNDQLDSVSAVPGKALVRYINAITDSSGAVTVNLSSGGTIISSSQSPFAFVSGFSPVNAGAFSIAIKNSTGIDSSRTVTLDEKTAYTFLLIGVPHSTTTPVQIKYIINGTLTDSAARQAISSQGMTFN